MKHTQIISDPKILGGKPVISGTRISVELILDRMAAGMNVKEILADYPHLTVKQIQAAVSYAKKLVVRKASKFKKSASSIPYTNEVSR